MEGDLGWCHSGGSSSSNNWDLHAVVRFACGGAAGHGAPSSPSPSPSDDSFPWLSSLQPQWPLPTDGVPTVDDILAEPKAEAPQPSSPRLETQLPPTPADEAPAKPRPCGRGGGGPTRSKRKSKKREVNKEVTRVPAGGSPSADPWAWRKYGQKPIKGSPYPRGYYRCSTDKDCRARKQVERCRADPGTLIVTYTGEHSHPVPLHRNSLAGTTRSKPKQPPSSEEPQQAASDSAGLQSSPSHADTNKPQGSTSSCAGLSPATPLCLPSVGLEYEDDEEDVGTALDVRMLLQDMDMNMVTEDDSLLFLQPEEPAPVGLARGGGCDGDMLLPNNMPEEPAPVAGSNGAGACDDDAMLFPMPEEPRTTCCPRSYSSRNP